MTIGSGDFNGIYFPVGLNIAKMINARRDELGLRATVEATGGSVFNINAIAAGYLAFGLAQSDKQCQAFRGHANWEAKGPQRMLRSVFSLHHEAVNLVAAADAGIRTIADLRGKRVNLGNPGAGQHQNAIDALMGAGIDPFDDILAETVGVSEALDRLQAGRIDAFFCTLGHPSLILERAAAGKRRIRFIPLTGPGIDRMVSKQCYYSSTTVPVRKFYPGAENREDVKTFGVTATLCSSIDVPADVVYALTKAVFDNLEAFTSQHPATAHLSREGMLEGLIAPLHPGARRYYKEVGLIGDGG